MAFSRHDLICPGAMATPMDRNALSTVFHDSVCSAMGREKRTDGAILDLGQRRLQPSISVQCKMRPARSLAFNVVSNTLCFDD